MLFDDSDIKIAGSRHNNKQTDISGEVVTEKEISLAKELGKNLSVRFLDAVNNAFLEDNDDPQMLIQRQVLLAFTVSVTLDEFCLNDTLAGIAEKSFLDALGNASAEISANCNDTGAFSFYYLAYRRKTEVDRRIGQTFAMLCAHDGDSIFQELGEALYCWFSSVVRDEISKSGIMKIS